MKITKDANYNFTFASLNNGVLTVEPEKIKWDLTRGYSVYQTSFGTGMAPYNFSNLSSTLAQPFAFI